MVCASLVPGKCLEDARQGGIIPAMCRNDDAEARIPKRGPTEREPLLWSCLEECAQARKQWHAGHGLSPSEGGLEIPTAGVGRQALQQVRGHDLRGGTSPEQAP